MRLGLLLAIAGMAVALSGAVMAEPGAPEVPVEGAEQAPMALESESDTAEMADMAEDSDPAAWDVEESDLEVAAAEADAAPEESMAEAMPEAMPEATEETSEAMTGTGELTDVVDDVANDVDDDVVADEVAWDDFDDPTYNPADEVSDEISETGANADTGDVAQTEPTEIEGSTLVVNGVTLGPVGIDSEGRVGRVHTVKTGDTLWDVSHAYLGTAWVWPSVWSDNGEIANPHVIEPGDRLWISSTEIRPISDEQAEEYLAANEPEPMVEEVAAELPADFEPEPVEEFEVTDEEFAAAMDDFAEEELDQLPVGMPDDAARSDETGRTVRVAMRENMSFVSDAQLSASTTILGSPSDRRHLSMLDTIYFGLGEGEVEVGDEFTFFRNITDVRSPSNNDLLGFHVDVLGWAEVIEVTGETSVAVIRVSIAGTMKGDRAMPRYQPPTDITVKYPKGDIDGEIAFLPASRTLMGTTDYVFVDVGAMQGVEIGTDLEVYDEGSLEYDGAKEVNLMTPDRVIADLVVITVQEETAVAYIAHTRRELAIGDAVRGTTRDFPSSF